MSQVDHDMQISDKVCQWFVELMLKTQYALRATSSMHPQQQTGDVHQNMHDPHELFAMVAGGSSIDEQVSLVGSC